MPEVTINPELLELMQSLGQNDDMNMSLARLLEKEIQRELAIYEHMAENFRQQYGMTFDEFANSALMKEPPFHTEQDYFDWEMATTLIQDLHGKLGRLYKVVRK